MQSEDVILRSEIDELLKSVKEKEKRSAELWQAGERQLSYAMSIYP